MDKSKLLSEFILNDGEKEVRKEIGKYKIYEINEQLGQQLSEVVSANINNDEENNKKVEIDMLIEYLKLLTDLPEDILESSNFDKIIKNPKKIIREIIIEVLQTITEYFKEQIELSKIVTDSNNLTK